MGYFHPCTLKSTLTHKPSAYLHPEVVDPYLADKVSLGRMAGPFDFGVIAKMEQSGQWHLIVDLSFPPISSVNCRISAKDLNMWYIHVDHISRMVTQLRLGAFMAKFDVEAAYQNVPVHPSDRVLLGMKRRGKHYADLALPFGL